MRRRIDLTPSTTRRWSGCCFSARNGTWALAGLLGLLAIWLPKHLFASHYHQPAVYDWINEPSLVLALFVTACWWRTRRDGRLPPAATTVSPLAWALMYLFPGHALNPMVFSPGDVFRARRFDVRAIGAGLLLVAVKAAVHTALGRFFGQASYAGLDLPRMATLTRAELWGVVSINYLDLVVTLSGTSDVAILLARLYGWPMASPFRYALLAWNPVELWRRWGIYNRKLLLTLVYFPLGGRERHRTRNVLATFLASALLLHTGWFGSKYWAIGLGGWRDQSVYFLVQGLLVCGCLFYRDLRDLRRGAPRERRPRPEVVLVARRRHRRHPGRQRPRARDHPGPRTPVRRPVWVDRPLPRAALSKTRIPVLADLGIEQRAAKQCYSCARNGVF